MFRNLTRHRLSPPGLALLALCLAPPLTGCEPAEHAAASGVPPKAAPAPLVADGIENLYQLASRIYSGGQPQGDSAFASLQKMGIKTIVSVDGAQPDVATAERFGLRYVHIPIGYSGVATSNAWALAKVVQISPGPVFIHCHHGVHRGPAAAALACQAVESWSSTEALNWLKTAGTATNYLGLYRSVREFRPPTPKELNDLPSEFPSRVRVPDFAAAMVDIDARFDALKAIRNAGFRSPADQPDLSPANQSLILWESFREAQKLAAVRNYGDGFVARMAEAEAAAKRLQETLKNASTNGVEEAFQSLARTCSSCHRTHRD